MSEIEKIKPGALQVTGLTFSQDELAGGMDTNQGGYLTQYPLFIKASQNQFEVFDQRLADAPAVATLQKITGVILYAHSAYKLNRGTLAGVDPKLMTADDKKTVCLTYGTPWGRHQKSEGNFKGAMRSYLGDKELRAKLTKRLYVFIAGHGIENYKGDVAVLSLGGTGLVEWGKYNESLTRQNLPASFVMTEITLVPAKTESGQAYFRPMFKPMTDESGAPLFSARGADAAKVQESWRKHVVPMVDKVKAAHVEAMRELETQEPFSVADQAKAESFSGAAFGDDEEIAF